MSLQNGGVILVYKINALCSRNIAVCNEYPH